MQTPVVPSPFYSSVPESDGLAILLQNDSLQPAPDDSWLVCADVQGSTMAIAEGRYKEVNLVGAACITAVLNACSREDLPFIFGGDGAMLLVSQSHIEAARLALAGTVRMAREALHLELRAGMVPLKALRAAGTELRVGRVRMSPGFHQAAFMGGAAALADRWLKENHPSVIPVTLDKLQNSADFSGLECRWQGIRPKRGAVATLIVEPRQPGLAGRETLQRVLIWVETYLGQKDQRRPVAENILHLAGDKNELRGEAQVISGRNNPPWWQSWKVKAETEMGRLIMKCRLRLFGTDWGRYKTDAAANTDFEKLDDTLRMVVAADRNGLALLRDMLENALQAGELWYGLEISEECRMTCLVFVRGREHFHFVDGASGGYAAAAYAMKRQKAKSQHAGLNKLTQKP